MSTGKKRTSTGKPASSAPTTGDAELVDRLRRAMGAYQLRTGRSYTWRQLGEACDLSPSSMTDILSLRRKITIREAETWAKMLGVEFAWLAIEHGPMVTLSASEAARYGAHPAEGERAADLFARRERERDEAREQATRRRERGRNG